MTFEERYRRAEKACNALAIVCILTAIGLWALIWFQRLWGLEWTAFILGAIGLLLGECAESFRASWRALWMRREGL